MRSLVAASVFFLSIALLTNVFSSRVGAADELLMRVSVQKIPESALAPGVVPSEDSYSVLRYNVLKLIRGTYAESEIKIAHFGESEKNLKVGDVVCIRIERTRRFRETAQTVLEDFGIVIPEELLADYVFEDFVNPKS